MDLASRRLDPGGLDGGDFLLTQGLADNVQATGKGGVTECAILLPREGRADDSRSCWGGRLVMMFAAGPVDVWLRRRWGHEGLAR